MLWNADYSQLELRIFASVTRCQWMVNTFAEGGDIHAATAEFVLGIPKAQQTPVIRVRAKTLNFGMAYGAQGETVEDQIMTFALRYPELEIAIPSLAECKEMVKLYWQRAPEAQEWKDFYTELVRDRGYSETLYGRRRYLPFIRSQNQDLRSGAERQAINHVIQGTAADIIKMAALLVHQDCLRVGNGADLRAQIHDELMGKAPEGTLEEQMEWLKVVEADMLLDQPLRPVPLKVEPKLVANWKEAK